MPPTRTDAGSKKPTLFNSIALFVLLLAFIVLARVFNLGSRIGELRAWILSLGGWGPFVYIVIYAVAVVLAIPGSVMMILAASVIHPYPTQSDALKQAAGQYYAGFMKPFPRTILQKWFAWRR